MQRPRALSHLGLRQPRKLTRHMRDSLLPPDPCWPPPNLGLRTRAGTSRRPSPQGKGQREGFSGSLLDQYKAQSWEPRPGLTAPNPAQASLLQQLQSPLGVGGPHLSPGWVTWGPHPLTAPLSSPV